MDDLIPTPKENWERIPVDPEGLAKLPPEEAEALLWLVGELEKGLNSGDPVPRPGPGGRGLPPIWDSL